MCRFVNSKNRAGLSYRLAVNHLADLSDDEFKVIRGLKHSAGYNGGLPFDKAAHNARDVPDHIDWRLYGITREYFYAHIQWFASKERKVKSFWW